MSTQSINQGQLRRRPRLVAAFNFRHQHQRPCAPLPLSPAFLSLFASAAMQQQDQMRTSSPPTAPSQAAAPSDPIAQDPSVTYMLLLPPTPFPDSTRSCYYRRHAHTGNNQRAPDPSLRAVPCRPFPTSSKPSSTSTKFTHAPTEVQNNRNMLGMVYGAQLLSVIYEDMSAPGASQGSIPRPRNRRIRPDFIFYSPPHLLKFQRTSPFRCSCE
jgi:hypothetical protein